MSRAVIVDTRVTREKLDAYLADLAGDMDPLKAFEKLASKSIPVVTRELYDTVDTLR